MIIISASRQPSRSPPAFSHWGALVAMRVTPATTADLLTNRLSTMMILAAIFASLSCVIGLYISFYLSVAFGAAIVLTATLFFMISIGWKNLKAV